MNKLISLILSVFIAGLAIADPNGGCNFKTGSPGCVAYTGKGLTLATQGPQDITFKTNDTARGTINGTTGAWTGLTLASPTITGTISVGALAGASPITVSPGSDVNRLFSFGASSDIVHTLTFGDAGVTAVQTLLLSASTADADDDSTITVAGGGGFGATRGGGFIASGNELATTGGSFRAMSGDVTTANTDLEIENASSSIRFRDTTTGTLWSITDAGVLTQDATNGGNIVMPKAATGLIIGKATVAADAGTTPGQYVFTGSASSSQLILAQGTADTAGVSLDIVKSRATDGTADTIIVNGDTLGTIRFRSSDGAAFVTGAAIQAFSAATPGSSNDMPTSLAFQTVPDGSGTLATVLTLTSEKLAIFAGTVTSTRTTDLGWSFVDATDNQACNTGCTSACVFGIANATGTAVTGLVSCSDATADSCICAGAS